MEVWKDVANELQRYPNVIFEFWNEPHGDNQTDRDQWFEVVQKCIDAVRATGSKNLIIIHWGFGVKVKPRIYSGNPDTWMERYPLRGENLVCSVHVYRDSGQGNGMFGRLTDTTPCDYDEVKEAYKACALDRVAKIWNRPMVVGEIGAFLGGKQRDKELEFLRNSLGIFNEWELGYIVWVWEAAPSTRSGFGVLQNASFVPAPNEAGDILIAAIRGGGSKPR